MDFQFYWADFFFLFLFFLRSPLLSTAWQEKHKPSNDAFFLLFLKKKITLCLIVGVKKKKSVIIILVGCIKSKHPSVFPAISISGECVSANKFTLVFSQPVCIDRSCVRFEGRAAICLTANLQRSGEWDQMGGKITPHTPKWETIIPPKVRADTTVD